MLLLVLDADAGAKRAHAWEARQEGSYELHHLKKGAAGGEPHESSFHRGHGVGLG